MYPSPTIQDFEYLFIHNRITGLYIKKVTIIIPVSFHVLWIIIEWTKEFIYEIMHFAVVSDFNYDWKLSIIWEGLYNVLC